MGPVGVPQALLTLLLGPQGSVPPPVPLPPCMLPPHQGTTLAVGGHVQAATACPPLPPGLGLEPCSPHTQKSAVTVSDGKVCWGEPPGEGTGKQRAGPPESDHEAVLAVCGAHCGPPEQTALRGSPAPTSSCPARPMAWGCPGIRGSVRKPRQSCQLTALSREPGTRLMAPPAGLRPLLLYTTSVPLGYVAQSQDAKRK